MRRLLVASVLIWSCPLTSVAAQQAAPLRIGAHVAGNMMNGPFDFVRVGGQLLIPLGTRVDVTPAVSHFLDGADWQVSVALRYRPFAAPTAPLYIGAGWTGINYGGYRESYDLWLAGVEVPVGRLRPYVEMQFLGPIVSIPGGVLVQAYAGITWAAR